MFLCINISLVTDIIVRIFLSYNMLQQFFEKETTTVFDNGLEFQNNIRSSQQRCSLKTGVLKNFTNFTGNYLCWSLILINLQINNILNISYLRVKIKKAKTWKTDILKICFFPEFKIKLIILQQQYLRSCYNTIKPLVATFSKTTALSSRKYVSKIDMSILQ